MSTEMLVGIIVGLICAIIFSIICCFSFILMYVQCYYGIDDFIRKIEEDDRKRNTIHVTKINGIELANFVVSEDDSEDLHEEIKKICGSDNVEELGINVEDLSEEEESVVIQKQEEKEKIVRIEISNSQFESNQKPRQEDKEEVEQPKIKHNNKNDIIQEKNYTQDIENTYIEQKIQEKREENELIENSLHEYLQEPEKKPKKVEHDRKKSFKRKTTKEAFFPEL